MNTRHEIAEVEVADFDEGLLGQAAGLRTAVFGRTVEENERYLRWKFVEDPYFSVPVVHLALKDGAVVGFRGAMGSCWEREGRRHVLPHGADLMVDERVRRRGIASRMHARFVRMLQELGHDVAISFSAGTMGVATALANGWEVVAPLDATRFSRTRPTRTSELVRRGRNAALRVASLALGSGTSLADPFARLDRRFPDVVQEVDPKTATVLAAIAARATPSHRLRQVRDADYFTWRLRNPLSRYRVLLGADAYLVLQWSGHGTQVNLVDWRTTTRPGLAELVRLASRQVANLRLWDASLDEDMRSALTDLGAATTAPGPVSTFIVRSTTGEREDAALDGLDPFELSSWEIRMLDSDEY